MVGGLLEELSKYGIPHIIGSYRMGDKIVTQVKESPESKEQIIRLKEELIARKLYSMDQYTSMDVYHAVLNQHIANIESFLANYRRD